MVLVISAKVIRPTYLTITRTFHMFISLEQSHFMILYNPDHKPYKMKLQIKVEFEIYLVKVNFLGSV